MRWRRADLEAEVAVAIENDGTSGAEEMNLAVLEVDDSGHDSEPASPEEAHRRRHFRRWWIAGAAVAAALAGGGVVVAQPFASAETPEKPVTDVATEPIEEGTLAGTRTVPGVLDYSDMRSLTAGAPGVVTDLPAPGTVVGRGEKLYAVNNERVFLLIGGLPAWRSFEQDMSDGPDVKQLEDNLRTLGYLDVEPDDRFSWWTTEAIMDWQEANGEKETGQLDLGRFVVATAQVRVSDSVVSLGDTVGPGAEVLKVSSLAQAVTGDLKLADQRLGVVGASVAVGLPGGESVSGTITEVGPPTERESQGNTSVVIPLKVALDDPSAVNGIQRANVTVDVPSETRENVLHVPVEALVALGDGRFGVQTLGKGGRPKTLPVETGLFAGGRVEISGKGIKAGLDVVVPER